MLSETCECGQVNYKDVGHCVNCGRRVRVKTPVSKTETVYRGYVIREESQTSFSITDAKHGFILTRCASKWSAVSYIDECLSP